MLKVVDRIELFVEVTVTGSELYGIHAAQYAEMNESKAVYVEYERPTTHRLAGDPAGLEVLDLGCGPGGHIPWLLQNGATVTAIDSSDAFLDIVRRKHPEVATVQIDLNDGLQSLPERRFDLVIASLVLHYASNLYDLLRDVRRVLRPGGKIVASVHHPFNPHIVASVPDYLQTCIVHDAFGPPGAEVEVRYYHRPLCEIINPFIEAGFGIEQIEEPPFQGGPLFLFLGARVTYSSPSK